MGWPCQHRGFGMGMEASSSICLRALALAVATFIGTTAIERQSVIRRDLLPIHVVADAYENSSSGVASINPEAQVHIAQPRVEPSPTAIEQSLASQRRLMQQREEPAERAVARKAPMAPAQGAVARTAQKTAAGTAPTLAEAAGTPTAAPTTATERQSVIRRDFAPIITHADETSSPAVASINPDGQVHIAQIRVEPSLAGGWQQVRPSQGRLMRQRAELAKGTVTGTATAAAAQGAAARIAATQASAAWTYIFLVGIIALLGCLGYLIYGWTRRRDHQGAHLKHISRAASMVNDEESKKAKEAVAMGQERLAYRKSLLNRSRIQMESDADSDAEAAAGKGSDSQQLRTPAAAAGQRSMDRKGSSF